MAVNWAAVKAFYFRNENVILRLPFSLCLQNAAYFVTKAKGEGEVIFIGLVVAIGLFTHIGYLQKFYTWLIEQVILAIVFQAIFSYLPSDVKEDISAQVCIVVSVAIALLKWATILSAKQTVGMFIVFTILVRIVTSLFVGATSISREICLIYLMFASVIPLYKACLGVLQLLQDFPGFMKHTGRIILTHGWLNCFIFHWKRIELDKVLMVTWFIKFWGKFISSLEHGVLNGITGSFVECFDNLQDLAGASIVVGVAANIALDIMNRILKGNVERTMEERQQVAWTDSIYFFILLNHMVVLTSHPKPTRHMLIAVIMYMRISLFFLVRLWYELTRPELIYIGETYTGVFNTKHLRTLAVCGVILLLPGYMILVLCQLYTFDTLLFVTISCNLVTIVQVTGSLFTYALLVSNFHFPFQDLDDYIYYINAGSKVLEFLVALVVTLYSVWNTIIIDWNITGSIAGLVFASFNVFKRAQDGCNNFLLRCSVVKRVNSLEWATEEQLEQLNDVCCVCREELDSVKVTKCNHYFHSVCLRKWLYVQDKCPMCHADILPQD